jgi:hypothetical protein
LNFPNTVSHPQAASVSMAAVVSLISGILTWVIPCVAVLAIPTGHIALKQIRSSNGQLRENLAAKIGLVLGYIYLVFTILVIVFYGIAY